MSARYSRSVRSIARVLCSSTLPKYVDALLTLIPDNEPATLTRARTPIARTLHRCLNCDRCAPAKTHEVRGVIKQECSGPIAVLLF
jgi:hypothetical protein